MNFRLPVFLVKEALAVLRAPYLSSASLDLLSSKRLQNVLLGIDEVPLYRERIRDAGIRIEERLLKRDSISVLRSLPPITKQELQGAGTAAVRGGRMGRWWYSSLSSGSTGEPLRIYYDARAWAILKYLVKYRARAACGLRPHHKVALLDAIPPEQERRTLLEKSGRLRRISVFRPAEEVAQELVVYSPDIVYALPSALNDVAMHLGNRAGSIGLKAVFTSGEFLLESEKNYIGQVFACPVFDIYGSSETKEVAWECGEGCLHVNADVVMVEILGEDGEVKRPGEEGEIVATLLVNQAMPLIRYRTGDRGSLLPGGCHCGMPFPKLGVLAGREADSLQLDDGRGRVSPYVLTCALEQVSGLRRYQVKQVERRGLEVRAIIEAGANKDDTTRAIEHALERAIPGSLKVTVDFRLELPRGPGAKFRVVEPLQE